MAKSLVGAIAEGAAQLERGSSRYLSGDLAGLGDGAGGGTDLVAFGVGALKWNLKFDNLIPQVVFPIAQTSKAEGKFCRRPTLHTK